MRASRLARTYLARKKKTSGDRKCPERIAIERRSLPRSLALRVLMREEIRVRSRAFRCPTRLRFAF